PPIVYNLHRSDHEKKSTIIAEVSSTNSIQVTVNYFQYSLGMSAQSLTNQRNYTDHIREPSKEDGQFLPDQFDMD
ncbi:unnamed protein product, partial [Didymodactylos carnosus]